MISALNLPPDFTFYYLSYLIVLSAKVISPKQDALSLVHHLTEILTCSTQKFPEAWLVLHFIETSRHVHDWSPWPAFPLVTAYPSVPLQGLGVGLKPPPLSFCLPVVLGATTILGLPRHCQSSASSLKDCRSYMPENRGNCIGDSQYHTRRGELGRK